ncbi:hypothetical protein ONS95_010079 [Cadophora gregata]|uniref:uncharacterized protein n=1 Tax=Cadophora gregata TaxID=51156 RepID=UPI0026DC908F|nr:uncharacterized protein ONS95_010079 [Cadophora gregata]KAK0121796.1 hypothetical protein ONS95_010079 [Cadophora gregata]
MKPVDVSSFRARTRAVLTPVLDINIVHVSQDSTAAINEAMKNAIATGGDILRLTISCAVTNVKLFDANITLA